MIDRPLPINGLIAELEECLGKLDASGEILAGAHLSSAIDSLKDSLGRAGSRAVYAKQPKVTLFTVH